MERVVRIEPGQNTRQFARHSSTYGAVEACSFSIIYLNSKGNEKSLSLIVSSPLAHKHWIDGINDIIHRIRVFRENASLDDRYLKDKFELADTEDSGALSEENVYDLVASLNISMDEAVVQSMFNKVDTDENGMLDFQEFTKFMAILRRR